MHNLYLNEIERTCRSSILHAIFLFCIYSLFVGFVMQFAIVLNEFIYMYHQALMCMPLQSK